MVTADLGSVGDGRHVAQLLAQLVQLLHGHLGGGGGESVAGGGGCIGGGLRPLLGVLLKALKHLEEYH